MKPVYIILIKLISVKKLDFFFISMHILQKTQFNTNKKINHSSNLIRFQ